MSTHAAQVITTEAEERPPQPGRREQDHAPVGDAEPPGHNGSVKGPVTNLGDVNDVPLTPTRPRARDRSSPVEQEVFAATERLLLTVSARDLSVAQILKEAGIARGSFYHYFSSKWDVITDLVAAVMEDIYAYIEVFTTASEEMTQQEALRRSIEQGCAVWAQHRAVLRAILEHWREIPQVRTMWLGVLDRIRDGVAPEVDRARAKGLAPPGPDSRQLVTALLWGTANCLYAAGLGEINDLQNEESIAPAIETMWIGALYQQ